MASSPFAVSVALPEDLAELFRDLTTEPVPVRSTMATLVVDGIGVASTAITFLQGPPALSYWIQATREWLARRRHSGVGELRVKGPGGSGTFTITSETDLAELAGALHKVLFPRSEGRAADNDDLAL